MYGNQDFNAIFKAFRLVQVITVQVGLCPSFKGILGFPFSGSGFNDFLKNGLDRNSNIGSAGSGILKIFFFG